MILPERRGDIASNTLFSYIFLSFSSSYILNMLELLLGITIPETELKISFLIMAFLDELTPKRGFSAPKIPIFVLKSPL